MILSIITINYNDKEGLHKTIDSVIKQKTKTFEWIIIDGGSNDGSKELLQEYAAHFDYWCSEPDKGIYNAINKGIRKAHGDYCLFLNSGDCLHDENVITKISPELDGTDFVYGDTWFVNKQGELVKSKISPDILTKYYLTCLNTPNHQSTFIKTSLLKQRPYDESLKIVADWEQLFYEIFFNKKSYKHINITIADFMLGGVSSTHTKIFHREVNTVLHKYLTQQQLDTIRMQHFSSISDKESNVRMMEIAYDEILDSYYTPKTYKETFGPFMHPLPYHHLLRVRLFVWMSLHGLLPLVRTILKLKK